jgi:N-methylhydantoinase B
LRGGHAGAAAVVTLTTPDGRSRKLVSKGAFQAPAGSVIDMITPGSGGFGAPARRAPEAIGRDLVDGYVTPGAATRDYGVEHPDELLGLARTED